jgi:gliding motility-associated-like protein
MSICNRDIFLKASNTYRIHLILLLILTPIILSAQGKEANIWYFGVHAGIDFNAGSPPAVLLNGQTNLSSGPNAGSASISDDNGNLLFYSDGTRIWNRNHIIMQNGDNMGYKSTQGAMLVKDPGNIDLYYFFNHNVQLDFQYSVVDMNLDNGMGGVVPSKKNIRLGSNMTMHLSAVRHSNAEDVWVVAHGLGTNLYYSFLVTADSLHTEPLTSSAGGYFTTTTGYMKISPDGQKIGSAVYNGNADFFDLLDFNDNTGHVSDDFYLSIDPFNAFGVEFSSDNSKMYLTGLGTIFQYDLNAGNPQAIVNTQVSISNVTVGNGALQLGPDGKIYSAGYGYYLGVINNPNEAGMACNYDPQGVFLESGFCSEGLPSFIQSYLNDPEFTASQSCFGLPTQLTINNINGIDSVLWQYTVFPNTYTSTLFSPVFLFPNAGNFQVSLTVYSGLLQKTVIQTVTIHPAPVPELGNDTLFCANETISLILDAGPGAQYSWNNNFPTVNSTFVVTETGLYHVRVTDINGCIGRDTINVARYEEATIDITNLDITSPNCGSSDGAITGIQFSATDPFTVTWFNAAGIEVGSGNDLLNVSAGSYSAEVTYGNNCIQAFGPYSIADNDAPVIESALPEDDDHCYQGMGSIIVTPESGNVSDYQYSFNGTDFFPLTGEIIGLTANTYNITLKDQFGCISLPVSVEVQNVEGPEIYCHPTHATGADNGTITVDSPNTNLTYRLNFGPVQTTNVFTGLASGSYTVYVTDEFGCETQCEVTIENNPGIPLSAMAGDDKKCLNELANSNIRVSGVSGVKEFTASLAFDGQKLQCIHFNDSLPGIISTVYPGTSRVVLEWNGTVPLTTNDTISLGELVFETLESGFADINWDSPPVTRFIDENGNVIFPHLTPEAITIHDLPAIELNQKITYCQGESIHLIPVISGGAEPMTGEWNTPDGSTTHQNINIASAAVNHSGQYTYSVKDYFGCADTVTKEISVYPLPTVNLPFANPTHDTIYYEQTFQLETTPGYASYQWNTGDTTYYIKVTEEGSYSVIVQTNEGCTATNSAYLKDMYMPFYFNVPNAFTPNGDGMNDTFRPVATGELIRQFSMVIYNRWGQMIFETSDYSAGWDGKDAPAGVYSWLISYSNHTGKVFKMRGSVTLVR